MCHRRLNVFSHNNHQTNNGRKTGNPLNPPPSPTFPSPLPALMSLWEVALTGRHARGQPHAFFPFEWTKRAKKESATGCVVRS